MVLLIDIFYDFTCQDLPPAIEDSYEEFFGSSRGWFQAFLSWDPEQLREDVRLLVQFTEKTRISLPPQTDGVTPTLIAQIKTGILEVAEVS